VVCAHRRTNVTAVCPGCFNPKDYRIRKTTSIHPCLAAAVFEFLENLV
jgi:hypothetical protein